MIYHKIVDPNLIFVTNPLQKKILLQTDEQDSSKVVLIDSTTEEFIFVQLQIDSVLRKPLINISQMKQLNHFTYSKRQPSSSLILQN